ncbi:MAG: glycosyl hydrolase family 43, partial [Muribaculaceae bacterium]|nr:glycosyl hydrolase family 43 [Muribaculaceae bacterium]
NSGRKVVDTWVNFYSLAPFEDVRYISPLLPEGEYTLTVRVSSMRPNWTDKKRNIYGSRGHRLRLTGIYLIP